MLLIENFKECSPDKHKRRDNKFGITWCVKCGQLFTKPCNNELQENDKITYIYHNKNL